MDTGSAKKDGELGYVLKGQTDKDLKKHYLSLKMVKYQTLLNQALDIILLKLINQQTLTVKNKA
ncbi:Foldase protein PrsA precursor [Staphylococcus aureus]|nr:Foldase protein PrsA precursor [Staphylococcus aureus]